MSKEKFGIFNKKDFDQLSEIKKCDDFILLFLDASNKHIVYNHYANWYFKKSRFYGQPGHLYMNKNFNLFKDHLKRKEYLIDIMGRDPHKDQQTKNPLKPNTINEKIIKKIVSEYNTMVIVKNSNNNDKKFSIYHSEKHNKCINNLKNNKVKFIK